MMDSVNIWIASNCLSTQNFDHLLDTVQSLVIKQARLVISIYTNQNVNQLINLLVISGINFAVIEQLEPLSQFEHFRELTFCDKVSDDSLVTFITDDISLPEVSNFIIDNTKYFYYHYLCQYFTNTTYNKL
jgi:hypothetical protein